jgi:hypothetical protein
VLRVESSDWHCAVQRYAPGRGFSSSRLAVPQPFPSVFLSVMYSRDKPKVHIHIYDVDEESAKMIPHFSYTLNFSLDGSFLPSRSQGPFLGKSRYSMNQLPKVIFSRVISCKANFSSKDGSRKGICVCRKVDHTGNFVTRRKPTILH